jgi:hypothetical protein
MSNNRQVLPDNSTIVAPFPASTAIAVGDLLYWDSVAKLAKKASQRSDLGALALNQIDFAAVFLGVAQNARLATETSQTGSTGNSDRVVTLKGVFEYDCASATFKIGDLVGIDRDGTNTVNFNQQLIKVTNPALAIGVVIQEQDAASTTVRVALRSRIAFQNAEAYSAFQGIGATVLTDAAQTLTVATNPMLSMVPTAARNVTLPAEAQSAGLSFRFTNNSAGANSVTFLASGGGSIKGNGVVPQNKTGFLWCDGTVWNCLVSA